MVKKNKKIDEKKETTKKVDINKEIEILRVDLKELRQVFLKTTNLNVEGQIKLFRMILDTGLRQAKDRFYNALFNLAIILVILIFWALTLI